MARVNSTKLDEILETIIGMYRKDEDYGPSFSLEAANSKVLHDFAMHALSQGMNEIVGSSEIDFEKEMVKIRKTNGTKGTEAYENNESLTALLTRVVELLEGADKKAKEENEGQSRYSGTLTLYKKLNLMRPQSPTRGRLFSGNEAGPSQSPDDTSSETSSPG